MEMVTSLFDKRSCFLLMLCTLPLLFLPKINLITIGSETAGIRLDDVILLSLTLVLFWAHFASHKPLEGPEKWVLALTAYACFSFAYNRILFALDIAPFSPKIFYCFRMLEYFVFFYIGRWARPFITLKQLMILFLTWNVLIMGLQQLELVGRFSPEGYLPTTKGRHTGITSFPNEMGLVLNMIFAYLAMAGAALLPLFALFAVLITATVSRIAVAALVICFLGALTIQRRSIIVGALIVLPILCGAIGYVVWTHEALYERVEGLLSLENNIAIIGQVWDHIDPNTMDWENLHISEQVDQSWWMRLHKWCHAAKLYLTHPESWLTGVGPGVTSAALDGGILRVVVEYGIMGVVLFAAFFRSIARTSPALKWMVVALVINMIFFDAYLAYKPMSLLFFALGATEDR